MIVTLEFYKAAGSGKLDELDTSKSILHYRRSVIIIDHSASKIVIVHGSSVSQKIKTGADKAVKSKQKELGSKYKTEEVPYDDAQGYIDQLLQVDDKPAKKKKKAKSRKKPAKKGPIPQVPVATSSSATSSDLSTPKADLETSGPIIQEFQIAYYEEDDELSEIVDKKEAMKIAREVLGLVSQYMDFVNQMIGEKPSKRTSQNKLNEISSNIIDLVYS